MFDCVFTFTATASAATYTVDIIADDASLISCTDAAPNDYSLRGAISNASALGGADTINFDAAVFSIAQTITLAGNGIKSLVINSDLTINGPGANLLTVKGYVGYALPIFEISGGVVGINNLKLTGGFGKSCYDAGSNSNTSCGGGIYMSGGSLNVSGSTISNNDVTAYNFGGGIYIDGGSATTITNSTVSGNIAGFGAGIFVYTGTLNISNSNVSGNTAKNLTSTVTYQCTTYDQCANPPAGTTCDLGTQTCTRTVSNNGRAGGILNWGGGTVNVRNTTISGNIAHGYGNAIDYGGGGIDNRNVLTIENSTVTNNYGQYGGGIHNRGTLNLSNSIVAGNIAPINPDIGGAVTSGDYNLVQNGVALPGTHNITGQDAILGVLTTLNGGPTATMGLLQGSPAINAGDPNFDTTTLPYDQRGAGFARKFGSAIDIGAFEVQPAPSAAVSISGAISYGTVPVGQSKFVSGVLMSATGASSSSVNSDAAGAYLLDNLTSESNYTVTPTKSGNINGITAFDATLVLRCVAAGASCTFTDNQKLAADTNNSNSITAFDATQILRFVAAGAQTTNTGQTGTWKFNLAYRTYNPLSASQSNQNYDAILIGEINGSWIAP